MTVSWEGGLIACSTIARAISARNDTVSFKHIENARIAVLPTFSVMAVRSAEPT